MPLDETIQNGQSGHSADHATLKAGYDARGATQGALPTFTDYGSEHATIHQKLAAEHNALGETPTIDGLNASHFTAHQTLAAAHNARQVGANVLFQDDFSSGNFHKWGQLQWSTSGVVRNGNGSDYSGTGEYSGQVVNAGTGHETAARFELRNGDMPFGGTERTEIAEPGPDQANLYPTEGAEFWIEFDLKFDSAWPVPVAASGWCLIMQWHGDGDTSPPACLDIDSDDHIYIANNEGAGYERHDLGAVVRNTWQHWVWHIKFSQNGAVGFNEISIDGVPVLPLTHMVTINAGETFNYFKMGIYRDPDNSATGILFYDNFLIRD